MTAAAEREKASLLQEVEGLKIVVSSLRSEGQRAEEEKAVLQQILQHVQGRCQEKIKVCVWVGVGVWVCVCGP